MDPGLVGRCPAQCWPVSGAQWRGRRVSWKNKSMTSVKTLRASLRADLTADPPRCCPWAQTSCQTGMRLEDSPYSSWESQLPPAQLQPRGEVGGSQRGGGGLGEGCSSVQRIDKGGADGPFWAMQAATAGHSRLSRPQPHWSLSFAGWAGTKLGDLPPRPPHPSVTTGLSCDLFILGHRHTARRGLRSVGPRLLKIKIELVKLMQRLLL